MRSESASEAPPVSAERELVLLVQRLCPAGPQQPSASGPPARGPPAASLCPCSGTPLPPFGILERLGSRSIGLLWDLPMKVTQSQDPRSGRRVQAPVAPWGRIRRRTYAAGFRCTPLGCCRCPSSRFAPLRPAARLMLPKAPAGAGWKCECARGFSCERGHASTISISRSVSRSNRNRRSVRD